MNTSIIITTYNWPAALELVLMAMQQQRCLPYEVIVADDGSQSETAELVRFYQKKMSFPVKHVWQEDLGFRAAKIRNLAVAKSTGDYLIFMDGDCIARQNFLAQHAKLAEAGYFVAGHRILISDRMTKVFCQQKPIIKQSFGYWLTKRICGDINRCLALLNLPGKNWRKHHPQKWQGAKTCNLGVWREDFYSVNGFDESFQGWGYEDSDLVVRLIKNGVKRKSGKFATAVLHLGHDKFDRAREKINVTMLQQTISGQRNVVASIGVNQY